MSKGGIRTRVLAIALIPCVAMIATGVVVVAILAGEARTAMRWADYARGQKDLVAEFVTAIHDERTASLHVVSGTADTAALTVHRARTDAALTEFGRRMPELSKSLPREVDNSGIVDAFTQLETQLPTFRQAVELRKASVPEIDAFYMKLADVLALGMEQAAPYSPDAPTAADQITAAELLRAVNLHSRVVGLAAAAVEEGPVSHADRRVVAHYSGAYRTQLEALAPRYADQVRDLYQRLTTSPAWNDTVRAQNELAENGVLPIAYVDWQAAENTVDTDLMTMFHEQVRHANDTSAQAGQRLLERSIVTGSAVLVLAAIAFMLALLLAGRLVRRLRTLRSKTLELAHETLPAIIGRLHRGENVDADAETVVLDDGDDEIGQVAQAFAVAERTALLTATAEARGREGFNRVFLDIAYRNQSVVRRQMEVLDLAEAKQNDPEHLELLFQLDHLTTRARRNAENLLILGGGQPGRRWRQPVPLEQIVRSAISETQDLTHVNAVRLPEIGVHGAVVADIIHLLAELIDNATAFSPPQAAVFVHGNQVGRGVVVEVEDQGLGIAVTERERLNALLVDPPEFQAMAAEGQRHLGLFVVAQLARRHEIVVTLQESAYGGVKAIVLIPAVLLHTDTDSSGPADGPHRPELPVHITRDPIPRPPDHADAQLPPWPDDTGILPGALEPVVLSPGDTHNAYPSGLPAANRGAEPRRRAPLPRRQRLTHLAPQLQAADPIPPEQPPAPQHRRPAEQVRTAMSSFQRGTQHARGGETNSTERRHTR